jgi:hypothetical protein
MIIETTERAIAFNPFEEAVGRYEITDFSHNFKSLIIYLSLKDETKDVRLVVSFLDHIIPKLTNESYRGWYHVRFKQIYEEVGKFYPVVLVKNSRFMKELSEESYEITDMVDFKHYIVEDTEWTFDVASQSSPKVELFVDGVLTKTAEPKRHAMFTKQNK